MKTTVIIILVAAIVIASYYAGVLLGSETIIIETRSTGPVIYKPYSNLTNIPNATTASIVVPAIDQSGNGVATNLTVQVVPGSGKTLVNIDKLLFWVDTQNSIRTARFVAEDVLTLNMSYYDLVFAIEANATVIEGPSAGAALTVATIAALGNKTINQDVMITGTINSDGTIGSVGEILAKASAARDFGATMFLVPATQSIVVTYELRRHCEEVGWTEVCTTENIPKEVNIANETGINIIEVANIEEALEYIIKP
ncbi:MAG: hypothetical protein JSW41_02300 [Candidatus Aenigmatarchaeota archaeon]|nr:MAG: hypothetical protein JSW41_02300 [Candidatus Aenigmarchaeota archaeon]